VTSDWSLHLNGKAKTLNGACHVVTPQRPGYLCHVVWDTTHSSWMASGADTFFATPLTILTILIVAWVVRNLLARMVRRTVEQIIEGRVVTALRPLRGRAPNLLIDAMEGSSLLFERRRQRTETVGSVLRSGVTFVIFGIAALQILDVLGINIAPVLASAGVLGVAVAFGAQNLVRDFLTGLFMLVEDQYGVGDVVEIGTVRGSVEAVGLRTTRVRDIAGTVWHVRNGEINRVGNMSHGWSRAVLDVPLNHGADLPRMRELLRQVADDVWHDPEYEEMITEEPEITGVETLTRDGMTLRVLIKTLPREQWKVERALRARLAAACDAAGILLPGPPPPGAAPVPVAPAVNPPVDPAPVPPAVTPFVTRAAPAPTMPPTPS
jgi:small conductance mechanosensitive channel